jgi:putative glycosyltransferase (TIGR04372 family)
MIYKLRLATSNFVKNVVISLLFPPKSIWRIFKSGLLVGNVRTTGTIQINISENLLDNIASLNLAYENDHVGRYLSAISIRKAIIENVYAKAGVSDDYFPPLIGSRWTNHIGHLAVLALHSKGQEMGVLPEGKRYVLDYQNVANHALFDLFKSNFETLSDPYLSQLELYPPTQLLFENFHAIYTSEGVLETHAFIEKIFCAHNSAFPDKTILSKHLVEEIVQSRSYPDLELELGDKIVVVHLRNSGKNERRDVDVSTYLKAFSLLRQKGFRIMNIGPKVECDNELDIYNVQDRDLHPYLISKSEFTITTSSGPALLPGLFGIPNLTTNLTSIGRTMISSNAQSYSLPKSVSVNSQLLNFREILNSPMGYDEREKKDLKKLGVELHDNSSEEIYRAVEWMINMRQIECLNLDQEISKNSRLIQAESKAVTSGKIVPTYLQNHPDYLD